MTYSWARSVQFSLVLTAALFATPSSGQGAPRAPSPTEMREFIALNDWPTVQAALSGMEDPKWRQLFEAKSAASRLDQQTTQRILEPLLESDLLSTEQRNFALSTLAGVQFALGDYRAAERTADEWITSLSASAQGEDLTDASQFLFVAKILAGAPSQELVVSTPSPQNTSHDKVGLIRATVSVNGKSVEAVLDTGANLSVVSRSVADRLGLVMLDGEGSIGSATLAAVGAQLGVAERLTIAGAELTNVAFLVLEDDALSFPIPGGYTIDAIIGFPIFRALGRISFSEDGMFSWAPGGSVPTEQNLFAAGNDLFLEVTIAETTVALHLDSGATVSDLTAAFGRRAPAIVAAYREPDLRARRRASAGGAVSDEAVSLVQVPVRLAGRLICLPSIDLALEDDETGPKKLGSIGQDVLGRLKSYSIDFVSLRFEVAPESKHSNACGDPPS